MRSIRHSQGLTLEEVAKATGVARSSLSKVENGQMSLTYDKLLQISAGLQVDISALFGASNGSPEGLGIGRRSLTREGEGVKVETKNYDHLYLCADLAKKRMQPVLCRIRAHSVQDFGELVSHSGEEFLLVLEGEIEVATEFYAPVRLAVGEGVYIDSGMKHGYLSASKEDALALLVCSSSSEELLKALPPSGGEASPK
ncbi:XRE family transcriptional regulator [Parasphingorhabdus sp.]|uniref:helix-turn-helix domain-containing protein n=1 Tax=Parasphingorhabdus sp. TaxID=2709688 RepID=UPI0032F05526